MPIKFNHLHLKARDPEQTAAWYGRAFGLTVTDKITRPAGDLFLTCKMTDGTMVVINGPRFSTRAESAWFAAMGWQVINMTGYPEAWLARELGLGVGVVIVVV